MSKCEISINLADNKYHYAPGETIRGEVRIDVNADCKCKELTLVLSWVTHGKGNVDKRNLAPITIFSGEWHGAQSYTYAFELPAPTSPLTYHGTNLNVDWQLNCRADIPWAIDPKSSAELLIEPPTEQRLVTLDSRHESVVSGKKGPVATVSVAVFALNWCAIVLWINAGFISIIFLCIGIFIFLGALYPIVRRMLAGAVLGDVVVEVRESGDEMRRLHCSLRLSEKQRQKLTSAQGVLKVFEKVVHGSGTDKRTYTHELWNSPSQFKLDDVRQAAADPYGRNAGQSDHDVLVAYFLQPDAYLPSFSSSNNDLSWELHLHLDLPNAPDWIECISLTRGLPPA